MPESTSLSDRQSSVKAAICWSSEDYSINGGDSWLTITFNDQPEPFRFRGADKLKKLAKTFATSIAKIELQKEFAHDLPAEQNGLKMSYKAGRIYLCHSGSSYRLDADTAYDLHLWLQYVTNPLFPRNTPERQVVARSGFDIDRLMLQLTPYETRQQLIVTAEGARLRDQLLTFAASGQEVKNAGRRRVSFDTGDSDCSLELYPIEYPLLMLDWYSDGCNFQMELCRTVQIEIALAIDAVLITKECSCTSNR